MTGIVFPSPQSERRRLRRILARLWSLRDRGARSWRRLVPPEATPRRGPGGLYPIGVPYATVAPPRPGELAVRSRRLRESCFVELAGALSARTRAPLAEALEDALETDAEEIVLDLARLEAIDRAGLATVLTAHLRAADELKRLLIIPGPTPVQHVFDEARGPFLYASGKAARVSGRARSRDGRTGRSTLRRPGTRRGAAW